MNTIEFCTIPAIAAVCYGIVEVIKRVFPDNGRLKNAYPLLASLIGAALGAVLYLAEPQVIFTDSLLSSVLAGAASGLSATGGNELITRLQKVCTTSSSAGSGSKPRFYITGDKHRHFGSLISFCRKNSLSPDDVVIILGDSGFNYFGDKRDDRLKKQLCDLGVTLFCIRGNKENRPENIGTYGVQTFCGGTVFYEPKYPELLFAKDGEVYRFGTKDYMVIGGAHSVDRLRCLAEGLPFWEDEMPDAETKALAERKLAERGNRIDGFLTHTCPISCLPTEMFISTAREAKNKNTTSKKRKDSSAEYPLDIDRSTEEWLETLMKSNTFDEWYCGHYHIDKTLGKVHMLYKSIVPFCPGGEEADDR